MSELIDVEKVRKKVRNFMKEANIEDRIREELKLLHETDQCRKTHVEKKIIDSLKEKGLLWELVHNLKIGSHSHSVKQESSTENEGLSHQSNITGIEKRIREIRNEDIISQKADKHTNISSNEYGKQTVSKVHKSFSENDLIGKEKSVKKVPGRYIKTGIGKEKAQSKDPKSLSSARTIENQKVLDRKHTLSCKRGDSKYVVAPNKDKSLHSYKSDEGSLPIRLDNEIIASSLLSGNILTTKGIHDEVNKTYIKINPRKRHLHFEVLSGRAFLDHLLDESSSQFILFLQFRGQRFWTQPVPCSSQPYFKSGFMFELHTSTLGLNKVADAPHLLSISDKIHLVLARVLSNEEKLLVSSYFFEWRQVLTELNSNNTFSVELKGVGAESNIVVGIIDIRLTLIPKLTEPLTEEVLSAQIELEMNRQSEMDRIFLVYAKSWWKEYLSLHPDHSHRAVKIFQQDENLQMRPVFQYINVIEVERPLLELPSEAAWFVSLILMEKSALLGALPASEQWWNSHTFLCLKKGGCENHATLLCSLLLGFGFDAYVCIGTKEGNIPWTWVMTVSGSYVTFWESTTGGRYVLPKIPSNRHKDYAYPYKTVGCVFNHKSFYANIQESDKVKFSSFQLLNRSSWKNMSEAAISTVAKDLTVSLVPGWMDPFLHSTQMENQLRQLITEYRQDINLQTRWDIQLSHLIAPFLSIYETEQRMGIIIGTKELDELMSKNTPDGFDFKAVPMKVHEMRARRVLGVCLSNGRMKDIITCKEIDTRLAFRVYSYVYPENTISMWIMGACRYRRR